MDETIIICTMYTTYVILDWTGGLVGVVAAVVAVISTCVCSYVRGKHRRGREGGKGREEEGGRR